MRSVFTVLMVLPLLGAGIILLQIYLSKKQNKWLGLVLPGINVIFSLIAVMNIVMFNTYKTTLQTMDEYGRVINEVIEQTGRTSNGDIVSTIISIIVVLLVYNIPTLIFLAIYCGCREKNKKNKELDRMNIQDLE